MYTSAYTVLLQQNHEPMVHCLYYLENIDRSRWKWKIEANPSNPNLIGLWIILSATIWWISSYICRSWNRW